MSFHINNSVIVLTTRNEEEFLPINVERAEFYVEMVPVRDDVKLILTILLIDVRAFLSENTFGVDDANVVQGSLAANCEFVVSIALFEVVEVGVFGPI